jgi:hypothetical protein
MVPVSSMKTSAFGSRLAWAAFQRWRASATSGLACSDACRVFLKVILWRVKNRWIERSDVSTPSPLAIRALKVSRVRSVSFATNASSQAACGSSGERLLPPRLRGLTPPVRAWSRVHRTADAALTLNRSAALRRDKPAATSPTTLARRSSERALPMFASESEASGTHVKAAGGIPPAITFDSSQKPYALERFPAEWNHSVEKKSLQIQKLEHILVAQIDST